MRDTEMLRCWPQPFLQMPANIWLEGDMLRWRTGLSESQDAWNIGQMPEEEKAPFAMRPLAGCLQDFTALAEAGPEEVLAFARARGVLAIDPLVTLLKAEDGFDDPFAPFAFDYAEPVTSYIALASYLRLVVRIMAAVKKGRCEDEDLLRYVASAWGVTDMVPVTPSLLHKLAWLTVSRCWDFAAIRMVPSSLGPGSQAGQGKNRPFAFGREIGLWFGDWSEGSGWDHKAARRTRPDAMVAAPADHVAPEAAGYRKGFKEWVKPYREYMVDTDYEPHPGSRPSALYNALVFQVLKLVILEDGVYTCSNGSCERGIYTYNPERARKPPKGEDTKDWGNSKPRKDRPTAFCSEWCRKEYDTADKRKSRASSKVGASAPPEPGMEGSASESPRP